MVMLASEVHASKADTPIVVTESGMPMLANELHNRKARSSMELTEPGMAMLVNELHPSKALSPMMVTESGMATLFTAFLSTPHSSHEHFASSHTSFSQEAMDTIMMVPSGMLKCPSALTLTAAILLLQRVCCGRRCTRSKGCGCASFSFVARLPQTSKDEDVMDGIKNWRSRGGVGDDKNRYRYWLESIHGASQRGDKGH